MLSYYSGYALFYLEYYILHGGLQQAELDVLNVDMST